MTIYHLHLVNVPEENVPMKSLLRALSHKVKS